MVQDHLPSTVDQRQTVYLACGLVLVASVLLVGMADITNRYQLTAEPADAVSEDVREYTQELDYSRLGDDAQAALRDAIETGEARTAAPVSDRLSYTHPNERHYEYHVTYEGESYVIAAVETSGSGLLFIVRTYQVSAAFAGAALLAGGVFTRSTSGRRGLTFLGISPARLEGRFLATVYVSLLLPLLIVFSIIPLVLPAYVAYSLTPSVVQNTEIEFALLRVPALAVPPVWALLVVGLAHLPAELAGLAFLLLVSVVIAAWGGLWLVPTMKKHDDDETVTRVI